MGGSIADIVVLGAVWAAIYAVIAIGFSMVFGVARIFNLAHGAFFMVSCYVTYFLIQRGLGLLFAAPAAIISVSVLSVLVYIGLIKFVRASMTKVLLLTVGVAMAMEQTVLLTFSPEPRFVPSIVRGGVHILGIRLTAQQMLAVGVAISLVACIWLIMVRTNLGRVLRAVAYDHEMASIVGINEEKVNCLVMAFSAGLAAVAGVLVAPFLTVSPAMGWSPLLASLTIVVLGGMGNIAGTLAGAIIVSYVETITSFMLSPQLKEAVTFCILILVLVFRPYGLFGRGVK